MGIETIFVIVIIAAAAVYTGRTLFRAARVGRKPCSCEDGCPVSDRCGQENGECAEPDRGARGHDQTASIDDDRKRRA